jgi:predicted esterase
MLPTGEGLQCRGSRPVLLYAHGTQLNQNFDIGAIEDVENNDEGVAVAAVFAAQGYVVVAPNYAGYDTSTLTYHPYMNADQQSKDMIDALVAAHRAMPEVLGLHIRDSSELFIAGFSQGGHVALATQRALQALGIRVTASAPMSGPYALAAYADAQIAGRVDFLAPLELALIIDSYQHAYGNIYSVATDIVQPRYANNIVLLPTNDPNVLGQRELPLFQLFDSQPPAPQFASITPATTPADIAPLFALGFGPNHLITNDYRLQLLLDAQTNPDGGWPIVTTGLPAANPANTLRQAFKRNDLRNWSPIAPVMMCGGSEDLNFINAELMENYWASTGAARRTFALNLDSSPLSTADPFTSLKAGFAASKQALAASAVAQGATDGGTLFVLASYHTQLELPYCFPAAHLFFERHRHFLRMSSTRDGS